MRFRWHGTEYAAEFIRRLDSGAVRARALVHGPRFAPGSEIEVQANEIVSMDEMPVVPPADAPVAIPAMAITPNGLVEADPRTGFAVPPAALLDSVEGRSFAPATDEHLAAIQTAMDTERETLPPVAEVIADPNPTQPLSASSPPAAPQTGDTMTDTTVFSRLQDKARLAAGAATEVAAAVEATFDDILARKAALLERNNSLHSQHSQIIDQANAGLDTIESALRQMSNGGPA